MGREIAAALARWPALIDHPVRPSSTAVCDINPAALDWFDQIATVSRTVTDYHELLADDAIDVVYVAVRHDLHERLYVDAIAAGKACWPRSRSASTRRRRGGPRGRRPSTPSRSSAARARCRSSPARSGRSTTSAPGPSAASIEARCAFLHASDLDVDKPINWKRQAGTAARPAC